ncbi:hypothetical protein AOA81_00015 [Methanomassiliicoccales archaeon RumEn M2]|jgi:hypothetical protein|nr:hypothetical protein AOA81_00015 [Methanomassiliicoccales archaeon RumEn M2]
MVPCALKIYIYAINKPLSMAKIGFGNPEDPHRIRNSSRRLFLAVLILMLALSIAAYLFRKDLLELMGGVIMYMVAFSMSLGIVFAAYRAITIMMKRWEGKR